MAMTFPKENTVPWLAKLRLRVFAILVALGLGVIGVIGVFSVPLLPAIGVALVAAVTVVNTMTTKLSIATCAGCGKNISKMPAGTYGITCTNCGTINQPYNASFDTIELATDRSEQIEPVLSDTDASRHA